MEDLLTIDAQEEVPHGAVVVQGKVFGIADLLDSHTFPR